MLGPTASGKSQLAENLAERLDAELLSVDSMQVYRGMDIGTAKPSKEARARFRYHLIDLADPEDAYSVAEFQRAGRIVLDDLAVRRVPAVVVGGSGLHFRSLVDPLEFPPTDEALRAELGELDPEELRARLLNFDPEAARHLDLANPRRVRRAVEIHTLTGATPSDRSATESAQAVRAYEEEYRFIGVGVDPGEGLAERIETRLDAMLAEGLLEEVHRLAPRLGPTAREAVGYRELLPVVRGEEPLAQGREAVLRATLALGGQQRTYFRRDPRIHWLPWHDDPGARLREAVVSLEGADAWTS